MPPESAVPVDSRRHKGMGMLIQPVLRPVLQPVLRSIFDPGIGGGGTPSLTAQVQALFAKYSAAGGMWDFTDMATLFQDSARTVPVTAASQPVGGVNDISGLHRVLAQPTSGKRPLFNGAGITPDGVDDFLVTAANFDLSACDKVVVGMGYEKIDDTTRMMSELSHDVGANAGSFWLLSGPSGGGYQGVRGRGSASSPGEAKFTTARGNTYGAHLSRHSIPADLSEVWWNGVKGIDGTGDKGTGNFGSYPLYLLSRAGTGIFSNTPTRRALVMGVPVAGTQVSDDDIELIRLWLMEGA